MVPLHSNLFFLKKQTSKNKTVLASILFIKQSKCSVNKKGNKLRKAKQRTSFNAPHFLPSDATSFTGLPNFLKRQLYIQLSKGSSLDNHFSPILLLLISWMNIVKSKTSFSVLTFCNQYGALGTLIVLFSSFRTVFPIKTLIWFWLWNRNHFYLLRSLDSYSQSSSRRSHVKPNIRQWFPYLWT